MWSRERNSGREFYVTKTQGGRERQVLVARIGPDGEYTEGESLQDGDVSYLDKWEISRLAADRTLTVGLDKMACQLRQTEDAMGEAVGMRDEVQLEIHQDPAKRQRAANWLDKICEHAITIGYHLRNSFDPPKTHKPILAPRGLHDVIGLLTHHTSVDEIEQIAQSIDVTKSVEARMHAEHLMRYVHAQRLFDGTLKLLSDRQEEHLVRGLLTGEISWKDAERAAASTSERLTIALVFDRWDLLMEPYTNWDLAWERLNDTQRRIVNVYRGIGYTTGAI